MNSRKKEAINLSEETFRRVIQEQLYFLFWMTYWVDKWVIESTKKKRISKARYWKYIDFMTIDSCHFKD